MNPRALSTEAAKKLIEKRNKTFKQAVDNLISSISAKDAEALVQQAGRDQVPINPNATTSRALMPVCGDRPAMTSVIDEIMAQEWYKDQIVDRRRTEGHPGQTVEIEPPLPEVVLQALKESRGIQTLYSHQVTAIQAIRQGKHVVVSTSTASGKSIIYQASLLVVVRPMDTNLAQVPLLWALLDNPASKAIFVYPTKALAQDQQGSLREMLSNCKGLEHLKVSTYDGDTPQEARAGLRESASVLLTNFDMLHASILPHEELWRSFFGDLKVCEIALLHASIDHLDHDVQFISCSATISNPLLHMRNLFNISENDIKVVTEDGAPTGPKEWLIWNPFKARSSLSDATRLMRQLMKCGLRVILFCKIRKVCELAMKSLRSDLSSEGRYDILDRVKPYRGGYMQEERRRIEKEAFSSQLLGIVATNALELGVDIGALDVAIMLGFPMSIASFRQQAGRVGRRSRDSLTILVADTFGIDQYYVQNPDELYGQMPDDLVVDLDNDIILEAHLQCAAYEMPLSLDDVQFFGPRLREICLSKLIQDEEGWHVPSSSNVSSISLDPYLNSHEVACKRRKEVEDSRAIFEVYEGGVFMHQGMTYIVQEVSHDTRMAEVIRADVNWITSPRDYTDVNALQTYRIREITTSSHRAYYGKIEVLVKVFGFYKIRNQKIIDTVDLNTPVWERETTGFWIDLPRQILELMQSKNIDAAEAIHAAQHALINCFGFQQDIKTECKASEKEYKVTESQRRRPARLIFYDAMGKGGGTTVKAFDHVRDLLDKADVAITNCPCLNGCQQCVQSPACKENNEVCSKLGAAIIIKTLLGRPLDPQQITQQTVLHGLNTIIMSGSVPASDGVVIETVS
ncbi:P-loop containing nucleoside triphosphate hydrolase protein [Amanita muscaria]